MLLMEFLSKDYEKIKLLDTNILKNKTIFITGANGLVGSNILSYLHFLNTTENMGGGI